MTLLEKHKQLIHWGTITWTFPEWEGIVYHKPYTQKTTKAESLAEYATFPSFSTVGIDHTFYAPLTIREMDERVQENLKTAGG